MNPSGIGARPTSSTTPATPTTPTPATGTASPLAVTTDSPTASPAQTDLSGTTRPGSPTGTPLAERRGGSPGPGPGPGSSPDASPTAGRGDTKLTGMQLREQARAAASSKYAPRADYVALKKDLAKTPAAERSDVRNKITLLKASDIFVLRSTQTRLRISPGITLDLTAIRADLKARMEAGFIMENHHFLTAAAGFGQAVTPEAAQRIADNFVRTGSANEINIRSSERDALLARVAEFVAAEAGLSTRHAERDGATAETLAAAQAQVDQARASGDNAGIAAATRNLMQLREALAGLPERNAAELHALRGAYADLFDGCLREIDGMLSDSRQALGQQRFDLLAALPADSPKAAKK